MAAWHKLFVSDRDRDFNFLSNSRWNLSFSPPLGPSSFVSLAAGGGDALIVFLCCLAPFWSKWGWWGPWSALPLFQRHKNWRVMGWGWGEPIEGKSKHITCWDGRDEGEERTGVCLVKALDWRDEWWNELTTHPNDASLWGKREKKWNKGQI